MWKMSGIPLKKSNVSYSGNKITKSLAVPLLETGYRFGTGMSDPVWGKAVTADDFVSFNRSRLGKKSEMRLFRTGKHLVIGFFFHEDIKNIIRPENEHSNPWSGDLAEIHFGDMEPDPWLWQLAVGVSGLRFDSRGNYDFWQAVHFETAEGWGAELRLDLSLLRITEGGFRFNLCRQALKRGELSSWSPLQKRFHEVENFGELLFTDYKSALQIKSGRNITGTVSRKRYESLRSRDMIPAYTVVHGPFLSAPDGDSMQISWETAGLVPSFLEYREKGSAAAPERLSSGSSHGILYHTASHRVHLTGLKPGTEYEYRIFALKPVVLEPVSTGVERSFVMPEKGKSDFSFFCITDIHSDVEYVRRAMALPEAGKADFIALLGDNLSHAAGREALYDGVVDPIAGAAADGKRDKPLVFVRGNHEQLGAYAGEFFTVMGHHSGKSYYSFSWGSVFFIVLDSGGDSLDYDEGIMFNNRVEREKQREFLEETIKSQACLEADFRVLMVHIPPTKKDPRIAYGEVYKMTEPLRNAAVKVDIALCGHIHAYEKVNANEDHYAPETLSSHAEKNPEVHVNPYPVIAHTNTAGLYCEVHPEEMILSFIDVLRYDTPKLIDRVIIKKQQES